jgi:hypothetical protein
VQACQMAFNTICTYIGTRDLVQEHISYKVWPLANEWEMPKEATAGSSQSGLVYLKYTFQYISQFDEPNYDWLDVIEATSDELLGAYSRTEDEAMIFVFGARGKKRLDRVFDVIGFVYPEYSFPVRKHGGKRKVAASTSSSTPKAKRVKVLTCRSKPIGTADVPKLIERTEAAPLAIETAPVMPIKASADPVKEPESEKAAEQPKMLSPAAVTSLPMPSSTTTATPRKRRMGSILDPVLESVKAPVSASAEASSETFGDAKEATTASTTNVLAEAGPLEATPIGLVEESAPEKSKSPAPKAPSHGELEFIVRHA